MGTLLEHATGLPKGCRKCHGPKALRRRPRPLHRGRGFPMLKGLFAPARDVRGSEPVGEPLGDRLSSP